MAAEFAVSPTDSPIGTPLERNISNILDLLGGESPVTPCTPGCLKTVLNGVIAYVEVRSENENRSKAVQRMLEQLGATTTDKFTPEVTHVVFKDGKKSTIDRAKKKRICLVSVLWVDSCKRTGKHVSEDLYPVHETSEKKHTPLLIGRGTKKNKSMQPKDFEEELANSSDRMEKKLKRRAMADKWKILETPYLSPRTNAQIYVEETQPRSPDEGSQYFSPSMTIPDTPPSMREKMDSMLRQQRLLTGKAGEDESSVMIPVKLTPLQRRLFGGNGSSNADGNSPGSSPDEEVNEKHHKAGTDQLLTPDENLNTESSRSAPSSVMSNLFRGETENQTKRLVASVPQLSLNCTSPVKAVIKKPNVPNKKSMPSKRKLLSLSDSLLPTSQLVEPTKATNAMQEKDSILDVKKPRNPRVSKLSKKDKDGDENKTKGKSRNKRRQSELITSLSMTPEISAENKKVRSQRRKSMAVSSPSVMPSTTSTQDSDSDTSDSNAPLKVKDAPKAKPKANSRRSMCMASAAVDNSDVLKNDLGASADVEQPKPKARISRRRSEMPPKVSPLMACSDIQTPVPHRGKSQKRKSDDIEENDAELGKASKKQRSHTCSGSSGTGTKSPKISSQNILFCKQFPLNNGRVAPKLQNSPDNDQVTSKRSRTSKSLEAVPDTGKKDSVGAASKKLSRRKSVAVSLMSKNKCPADLDSTSDEATILENPAYIKRTTLKHSAKGDLTSAAESKSKYPINQKEKPKTTKPSFDKNLDISSEDYGSETEASVNATNMNHTKISSLAKNRQSIDEFHCRPSKTTTHEPKIKTKRSVSYSTKPRDSDDQMSENGVRQRHRSQKGKKPNYIEVASFEYDDNTSDSDSSVKEYPPKALKNDSTKPRKIASTKPKVNMVMTSLHSDEQDIVISVVKKLGGFRMSETVTDTTTHVVCGEHRRTLNVLFAITNGLWLVSKEWVLKSLEAGKWVDEEPYELNEVFPAAQVSRLERVMTQGKYRMELLAGKGAFYVAEESKPPYRQLIQLVKQCGGQITQVMRKADVCIGSIVDPEILTVNEQWVLDSITHYEGLPFDKYILYKPDRRMREPSPDY